ncbi:urate hydroxylase PuuD [Marinicella litoralis]|uniref:Putative membrane protein n=1 Tax=Marinicella litoralis TaxID=644220 RepID=A0A4R6XQH7_9GAMM|nr:urate hydroxylase PuuD [Marinicella litoralis]TDR20669.1 putative membrane protein [Marinicella litoralis]
MEAHIIEWLNLSVRWIHIITGIAWIGASFYFVFLENNLNRTENLRDELAGNLWAIHGGGFYYLEKYKHAPKTIPAHLHWFKWEAYFTWLSGFTLLAIVYYYNAKIYMLNPSVSSISAGQSIGLGIGTLLVSWLVYDLLCKSALVNKKKLFALLGFVLIVAMAYGLTQLISARAAYIHVGAVIGTLMVANVFFVIIPSQKTMVNAAINGETSDPSLGEKALMRSIHNNYLTLPVLFIMISNHFPSTFGHANSWLVLAALILIGVAVRHWFNLKGKGIKNHWLLPLSLMGMVALVYLTKPVSLDDNAGVISDAAVMKMMEIHCQSCHAQQPSSELFATAPKDLMLEDLPSVIKHADIIKAQAVQSQIMPLGNSSQMTPEERIQLGQWLNANSEPMFKGEQ